MVTEMGQVACCQPLLQQAEGWTRAGGRRRRMIEGVTGKPWRRGGGTCCGAWGPAGAGTSVQPALTGE